MTARDATRPSEPLSAGPQDAGVGSGMRLAHGRREVGDVRHGVLVVGPRARAAREAGCALW